MMITLEEVWGYIVDGFRIGVVAIIAHEFLHWIRRDREV